MLVAEWNVTNEHFESRTSPETRATLIRQAFHLEYLTVVWMTIEAVVAIDSGIAASSLTLVAFGIDSVIELASAGVLLASYCRTPARTTLRRKNRTDGLARWRSASVPACRLHPRERWLEALDKDRR
jgi:hypothetical protein